MADRRGDLTVARNGKRAEGGGVDRTPAYASITERLRRGIESGSLPEGAVSAPVFASPELGMEQARDILARLARSAGQ